SSRTPSCHHSLYCFLQSYVPHRVLHSFPTRRSSDLCYNNTIVAQLSENNIALMVDEVIGVSDVNEEDFHAASEEDDASVRSLVTDRKSTRLNSSHVSISYAVFCLNKKKIARTRTAT